jgi:type IV fimbrial biogenesis protein FimT
MHTSMQGMTLVEMMVVLALIGIGMTIATPSFNAMIGRNQAATQINELVSAINLARSEASKSSGSVRVLAVSGDEDFADGWCVVAGTTADCTGTVIRSFPALTNVVSVMSESASIQFNSFGEVNPATSRNFIYCSEAKKRVITITPVGRTSIREAVTGSLDPADDDC